VDAGAILRVVASNLLLCESSAQRHSLIFGQVDDNFWLLRRGRHLSDVVVIVFCLLLLLLFLIVALSLHCGSRRRGLLFVLAGLSLDGDTACVTLRPKLSLRGVSLKTSSPAEGTNT
jgi:hypothetical protein